VTKNQVCKLP